MAMVDPLYASTLPMGPTVGDHDSFRRFMYTTQWMRYLEFGYLSGDIGPAEVELMMRQLFHVPETRAWWERARVDWVAAAAHNPKIAELISAMDTAFDTTAPGPDS